MPKQLSLPTFPRLEVEDAGHDILIVKGIIEPQLCDQIIQVAECVGYQQAKLALGDLWDEQIRYNHWLDLGGEQPLLQSTHELLQAKMSILKKLLYQIYGIQFAHNESCTILKYEPGQFYRRHIDNMLLPSRLEEAQKGIPIRDVSVVGYLNEACEGGETYFDRQDLKIRPKTGQVILFPAGYTHPHQSLPVTHGVKFAFNCWLFH